MATATNGSSAGSTERITNAQLMAKEVVKILSGRKSGMIASDELHERIGRKFGTTALAGARRILGDQVETGVREGGKSHWRLNTAA